MDMDTAEAPIVVTAPRLPEAAGEAVYSSFVIDAQSIERAVRLDEALAVAPSASLFRRNDSGAANPTVQGMSLRSIGPSGAGRALVTLDGVPQHDPFGGWVIWGALAPETIARATVIRGAGAGSYGAGALTGVINLEERQDGALLSIEGGERDYRRASGVAVLGAEDSLLLAFNAEHDDGWIPVREGASAADTPLERDAASGAARVQTLYGDVLVSARLSYYDEERSSGLAGANSSDNGAAASLTLVRAPNAAAPGWRLQAWARDSDMANSFVSVALDRSATAPASLQYETPAFGWGLNAAMRWTHLELGADVRAAEGETHEFFNAPSGQFLRSRVAGGETLSAGVYAEGWRALGDTLISGGVRLDWWSASDGERTERLIATGAPTLAFAAEDNSVWAPTARFGVRHDLGGAFVRGSIYSGFRPPTLNELHRPFRVGNDVTEANPGLEPERLYGADAAIGDDQGETTWSLGVFAVRLIDPVTNVTLGVGPGNFPPGVFAPAGGAYRARRNVGHIDAAGVEAEARGAFSSALTWRAALNFSDARVDGGSDAPQLTDLRPAQAPELSVTAGLTWTPWRQGSLSADARYESERFEDDQNTRTLKAATTIDLRLEQDLSDNVLLFAALDNALDANIATGVTADGLTSYAAPQTWRIGFRVAR